MMVQAAEKTAREHLDANEKRWDSWARTYDNKRFDFFRRFQKKAVLMTQLKEGQRFLDIGCGTGWAVRYAAGTIRGNGEFYGIDMSSKMIEKARENSRCLKNIRFQKALVEELPFESDFIDNAICTNSFHHYLDPVKALIEIRRVLKPGGRIYILDATADNMVIKLADRCMRARQPEHVKLYSTPEFRELFSKAGLKYVKTTSVWPLKTHTGEKAL